MVFIKKKIGLLSFSFFFSVCAQIVLLYYPGHELDAGRIGLCIVLAGMMGSVCCGIVLDKTHRFKWVHHQSMRSLNLLFLFQQIFYEDVFCWCCEQRALNGGTVEIDPKYYTLYFNGSLRTNNRWELRLRIRLVLLSLILLDTHTHRTHRTHSISNNMRNMSQFEFSADL